MTSRVLDLGFPKVLVVPKDFSISGARVLLAMGRGPGSRRAVEEVISLGGSNRTLERLTVLTVARKAAELPAGEALVREVCGRVEATGTPAVCRGLAAEGEPAAVIVDTARQENCAVVELHGGCAGSRARPARRRAWWGDAG